MNETHGQKILILSLLLLCSGMAPGQQNIPDTFCIDTQEHKLYDLINNFRSRHDAPTLQLSRSLSYVAKTHTHDLHENSPDTGICNLNSWSDKGSWTPCCHSEVAPKSECIWLKPRELTDYWNKGHELAYWAPVKATADSVFAFWEEMQATREFLMNQGKWEKYTWKAIGIGMYEGYASIWVGEIRDGRKPPPICKKDGEITERDPVAGEKPSLPRLIENRTNRYYIIYGSYSSMKDAKAQVVEYREKGFPRASIVVSGNKIRVSLDDYETLEGAKKGKEDMLPGYKETWILAY
ncbi:MAG: SPOR domain-containing protein [Bacteroidales bacterium]